MQFLNILHSFKYKYVLALLADGENILDELNSRFAAAARLLLKEILGSYNTDQIIKIQQLY